MDTNELQHHGIIGMKWGVRRTPAQLGHRTSTAKAKERAKKIKTDAKEEAKKLKIKAKNQAIVDKAKAKADAILAKAKGGSASGKSGDSGKESTKPKSLSEMTDAEVQRAINRKNLENQYNALHPKQESSLKKVWDKAAYPALMDAGKELATKWLKQKGSDLLGLNEKELDDGLGALKKQAKEAGLKKAIAEADKARTEADEKKYNFEQKKKQDKDAQAEADKKAKEADKSAKQAEKEAKKAEKEAKQAEKEAAKDTKANNEPKRSSYSDIIEVDYKDVTPKAAAVAPYRSRGEAYINNLLPAPKDDD